jgi:hypothetical protein
MGGTLHLRCHNICGIVLQVVPDADSVKHDVEPCADIESSPSGWCVLFGSRNLCANLDY